MRRTLLALVMAAPLGAWAQPAGAKDSAPSRVSSPAGVTQLEFDGELIEGATSGPDVEVVSSATPERSGSLIRLRESFATEVLASATEMP